MCAKNFLLCFFLICVKLSAQSLQIKVVDSKTNEPLPNSNVNIDGKTNIIANEEGVFNLNETQNQDNTTILISYLGYKKVKRTLKEIKQQNLVVKLDEDTQELESITINAVKVNPAKVMQEVKNRLDANYKTSEGYKKKTLFVRKSESSTPSKYEFLIDKSTGFTKKQLEIVDQDVKSYTSKMTNKTSKSYTDLLFNHYAAIKTDKKNNNYKLNMIKATIIKGDTTSTADDASGGFSKLFFKHLDSTKYYRVKSGWFASKDTIAFGENRKKIKKISNMATAKTSLETIIKNKNVFEERYEFINDPDIYNYTLKGKTYDENDNLIYILDFTPKKSRAIFTGTVYIADGDFAVLKCKYKLKEGETLQSLNLKLLLGIKMNTHGCNGVIQFKKDNTSKKYVIQYAAEDRETYSYIDRPIKFIELADKKNERDIFSFNLKYEMESVTKEQILYISDTEISENDFKEIEENDFKYVKLKKYDPSIWKNYISIEPAEAMKQYKTID